MSESSDNIIGVGGFDVQIPPTSMPSTTDRSEFQVIPIKFTLMGLPDDIPVISDFRHAAMDHMKNMMATVAKDVDGLKISDVKEGFVDSVFNNRRRELVGFFYGENATAQELESHQSVDENNRIFNLYYDIICVVSEPSQNYGPRVIDAVRGRHSELLHQIQEYQPTNFYYADNFDVCTTTSGEKTDDDRLFDLCSLDHKMAEVKFGALALPDDIDKDMFKITLMEVYQDVLSGIDGFEMTGMYNERVEEIGKAVDFYFDVNAIQKDVDVQLMLESELQSPDAQTKILEHIKYYTDKEGRGIDWCVTAAGRYSTQPCTQPVIEVYQMPTWLIITIAASVGVIAFGLCLWVCIVVYQRDSDENDFKRNCQKYIVNPDDFFYGQNRPAKPRKRLPPPSRRRRDGRVYVRPRPRYHCEERRRYRSPPRRHHRRRDSYSSEETYSDNEYQMVLYEEPAYVQRHELPQLPPPPQQQMLRIEAAPTRQLPQLLPQEGRQPSHPYYPQQVPMRKEELFEYGNHRYARQQPPRPHQPMNPSPQVQQEIMQIKDDPVYCDDALVNRPDPVPGRTYRTPF